MSVKVDLSGVHAKLSTNNILAGKRAMTNQALVDMNENFVPEKDGHLRNSASISLDGESITWNAVYARKHYYTDFSPNYWTAGTGPHWDKKAKGMFMKDWAKAFKEGAGL